MTAYSALADRGMTDGILVVVRRNRAQVLHHRRQNAQRGVYVLLGIETPQAEADAGARLIRLEPDGRSTCEGSTDPDEHAEPVEQAMPRRSMAMMKPSPSTKSNVRFAVLGTRCARIAVRGHAGNTRENSRFQPVAQGRHAAALFSQMSAGDFRRGAEADDSRHVFRAGPAIALVMPAVQQRPQNRALAHVERSDTLGAVQFVRGEGQQIDAELLHIDGNFADRLHRVRMKVNIAVAREAADLFQRLNRAQFVVRVHDRDQHSFRANRRGNICRIDHAAAPTRAFPGRVRDRKSPLELKDPGEATPQPLPTKEGEG